jgi:membrane-associated protein
MTPSPLLSLAWLDPEKILDALGDYALWGAAAIVLAECGLLIGFFLPGDSLLFTVGLLTAQDKVSYPIWLCCLVLAAAAVAGNALGYLVGDLAGPKLFAREDSKIFKKSYVDKTRNFFEKYGSRAVVLARFVPVVRTFITAMAGVGTMGFRKFIVFSAIGGVLWAAGVTALGYYLGSVPFVANNVEVMMLAFVAVALVPIGVEYLRDRAAAKLDEVTGD